MHVVDVWKKAAVVRCNGSHVSLKFVSLFSVKNFTWRQSHAFNAC